MTAAEIDVTFDPGFDPLEGDAELGRPHRVSRIGGEVGPAEHFRLIDLERVRAEGPGSGCGDPLPAARRTYRTSRTPSMPAARWPASAQKMR